MRLLMLSRTCCICASPSGGHVFESGPPWLPSKHCHHSPPWVPFSWPNGGVLLASSSSVPGPTPGRIRGRRRDAMSAITASFAPRIVGCLVLLLSGRHGCQSLRFLERCGALSGLSDGRGWTRSNHSMILFSMNEFVSTRPPRTFRYSYVRFHTPTPYPHPRQQPIGPYTTISAYPRPPITPALLPSRLKP